MKIIYCDEQKRWDQLVNQFKGHPLQLWGWGEVKSGGNWQVVRLIVEQNQQAIGGASLLIRRFPGPVPPLVYIPRGPFGQTKKQDVILEALRIEVKKHYRPLAISIEPAWQGTELPKGWRRAKNTVLVPTTALINLQQTEEAILAAMAKKTRQYINKSARSGVEVRRVETEAELAKCLEIYQQTAQRANFRLHSQDYYQTIWRVMGEHNLIFGAWAKGELVAFVWLVSSRETAFELYGGVNQTGQKLRANYTLKWQAILSAKGQGVAEYDLNGLLNDGISNFKRSFVEADTEFIGSYDYRLSLWYPLYSWGLPLAKRIAKIFKP